MIEITNRFNVTVTEEKDDPTGNMDITREFDSDVYAISSDEKKFLVYDPGDAEHESGFRWVNFLEEQVDVSDKIEHTTYTNLY